jgi:hypothetical protein
MPVICVQVNTPGSHLLGIHVRVQVQGDLNIVQASAFKFISNGQRMRRVIQGNFPYRYDTARQPPITRVRALKCIAVRTGRPVPKFGDRIIMKGP